MKLVGRNDIQCYALARSSHAAVVTVAAVAAAPNTTGNLEAVETADGHLGVFIISEMEVSKAINNGFAALDWFKARHHQLNNWTVAHIHQEPFDDLRTVDVGQLAAEDVESDHLILVHNVVMRNRKVGDTVHD